MLESLVTVRKVEKIGRKFSRDLFESSLKTCWQRLIWSSFQKMKQSRLVLALQKLQSAYHDNEIYWEDQ